MAELLLELFSEEIPARMQARAAADLGRALVKILRDDCGFSDIAQDAARVFATPRRLTAVIDGIPTKQADVTDERRGPRVDAPDKAIEGFLRSVGLDSADACEQRETKKGTFYFAVIEKKGRPTADLLAERIPALIEGFSWPKSMRWGKGSLRWVRPLQSVLCLFDGSVVPGSLALGHGTLSFSNRTRGHRWMAPDEIEIDSFAGYREALASAKVVLDPVERRRIIAEGADELARGEGLTFDAADPLLDEVAGLVEWPVCLLGKIEDAFMAVPAEVLVTSMKSHQKYFPLHDAGGGLANRFVVVANIAAPDGGNAIRAGNERVLRARLHDAKFFWEKDRESSLESRVPRLEDVVFHARLGSVGDKVRRLGSLAESVSRYVPDCDPAEAGRAAHLCKADLVSDMVNEFADLQGLMGRYYAIHDGEPAAVADAIADHYSPAGPSDDCPSAPVSVTLALAEKIDSLTGFFSIDEKPTGSKDPFALRRAALGIIRLILDNGLRLPLRTVMAESASLYGAKDPGAVASDLMAFFADRLRVHMRDQGLSHDLVSAVLAVADDDDLVRLVARANALKVFLETDDGANLLLAFRRAANIVAIEEKKDGQAFDGAIDPSLLALAEEQGLNDRLDAAATKIDSALAGEDFAAAMSALATLRAPLDTFFDKVTVNDDDRALRANRLRLLARIRAALASVADFTEIEG
jgi:glycyl-tRNA synthetase beta chain